MILLVEKHLRNEMNEMKGGISEFFGIPRVIHNLFYEKSLKILRT